MRPSKAGANSNLRGDHSPELKKWPELAIVRRILGQEPIGKDFFDIREDFSPKDHQAVPFFPHSTWTIPIHQTVLVETFLRGCPRLAQLWDAHKTNLDNYIIEVWSQFWHWCWISKLIWAFNELLVSNQTETVLHRTLNCPASLVSSGWHPSHNGTWPARLSLSLCVCVFMYVSIGRICTCEIPMNSSFATPASTQFVHSFCSPLPCPFWWSANEKQSKYSCNIDRWFVLLAASQQIS